MSELAPELLRKLLRYEPETGKLFWRKRDVSFFKDGKQTASHSRNNWNSRYAGKEALACHAYGYKQGTIFYRGYQAHRVIWAMETGSWPEDQIDHKNHNRSDNRIDNLREATNRENSENRSISNKNKSGVVGVIFHKDRKKWIAHIKHKGKSINLGQFVDKEDAIAAREAASIKFNYHPNHGKAVL